MPTMTTTAQLADLDGPELLEARSSSDTTWISAPINEGLDEAPEPGRCRCGAKLTDE